MLPESTQRKTCPGGVIPICVKLQLLLNSDTLDYDCIEETRI